MEKKLNNKLVIVDYFIVFLNITNTLCVIPYLLFTSGKVVNTVIIIALNILYLFFRSGIRIPHNTPLFYLFFIINFWNVLCSIVTDTFSLVYFLFFISNTLFYLILYSLSIKYLEQNPSYALKEILKPFFFLAFVNVFGILVAYILGMIGVNLYVNDVSTGMELFSDNYKNSEINVYYYPYYLSVLLYTVDIRIPFLQEFGILCGLHHEPHVLTFFLTPAFFMLLIYVKTNIGKCLLTFLFLLVCLMAASTTNIIGLLVCFVIFYLIKDGKRYIFRRFLIALFTLFFLLLILHSFEVINLEELFFIQRMSSGSADYSKKTIEFAFSPSAFLGTNFYDLAYVANRYYINNLDRYNVGWVTCILNLIFLSYSFYLICRFCFSKKKVVRIIGIAILYFFLHSSKVAMVTYSYSVFVFLIFIMDYIQHIYEKKCDYYKS